jgi:hypothetical protein
MPQVPLDELFPDLPPSYNVLPAAFTAKFTIRGCSFRVELAHKANLIFIGLLVVCNLLAGLATAIVHAVQFSVWPGSMHQYLGWNVEQSWNHIPITKHIPFLTYVHVGDFVEMRPNGWSLVVCYTSWCFWLVALITVVRRHMYVGWDFPLHRAIPRHSDNKK